MLLVYCFTVCLLRFWCVILIVCGLLITLVCLGWLVGLVVAGCFVVSDELFVCCLFVVMAVCGLLWFWWGLIVLGWVVVGVFVVCTWFLDLNLLGFV